MNALARIEQAEIDLLESFECRGYRRNCRFENKITGVFNTSTTPSRATSYQTFHGLRSTLDETLLTLIQKKEKQNRLKQSQFSIEKLTDFLDLAEIEQSSTNKAIVTLDELNALSLNFDSIDTSLPDHFHLKITQGVGRNNGITYKTFTSTGHVWFKDMFGNVYDEAEIKVNSSSCEVIDINLFIVSQSFKNKEALDCLNNSTVKERQFIARVSQAFFIDKGSKLSKNAAFGLLSIIRGDEKNAHSAIFSYGCILRDLLVGEFKIPKANTDSLPKLFKSAQQAFAA